MTVLRRCGYRLSAVERECESRQDHEICMQLHPAYAADAERCKPVQSFEPSELALHGCAATARFGRVKRPLSGMVRGVLRPAICAGPAEARKPRLLCEGQWAGRDSNPQDGTPPDAPKATAFASFATGPLTLTGLCRPAVLPRTSVAIVRTK